MAGKMKRYTRKHLRKIRMAAELERGEVHRRTKRRLADPKQDGAGRGGRQAP